MADYATQYSYRQLCVWGLATTGGARQIATGAGSSWDAADPEFFNGAGYGSNNATVEMMNPANLESAINGLSHFTVEFYMEIFGSDGGGFNNWHFIGIHPGAPLPGNVKALDFGTNGNGCTGGSNCLFAEANINGSAVAIGGGAGTLQIAPNKIHHIALTYDGSTLRLFVDGALSASTAASGNWTIPAFESFEICRYCSQYLSRLRRQFFITRRFLRLASHLQHGSLYIEFLAADRQVR